ncbi:MAG: LysR family transcriptional regulator [Pseudomonadota bacterium]
MRQVQIYGAIDKIARMGSIRRAAEALAISPSALNRQILAIEDDLGVPLFDRLSSGVRLSTAGEVYIKCFRDHLADLKRVESQIADLSGQRIGTVRIGVGPELSSGFLPELINRYQQSHPQVNFVVETIAYDDVANAVSDGSIDLAIAAAPVQVPGLLDVAAEHMNIVGVAVEGVRSPTSELGFADLAQSSLIVPTRHSGLRNSIDAVFSGRRITPRYLVETDGPVTRQIISYPEALWLSAEKNLDHGLIKEMGLALHRLTPETLPDIRVHILQLERRVLPVAAANVVRMLAAEIAA